MIDWMKYRYLYLAFSLLIIIPGLLSLFAYGLKLSIDFTGGTIMKLDGLKESKEVVITATKDLSPQIIESTGNSVTIRLKDINQSRADEIVAKLKPANKDIKLSSFETLGPAMGQETIKKTFYAILLASLLLLIHISHAFKRLKFGVSAILAMLHDSLVLLGIFSLLGHFAKIEIDLLFVTATLTVLSFSVHDTIVVFDRIREIMKHHSNLSMYEMANRAVSETMVRSLNNTLVLVFMLLALVLLGGMTTRNFALALLVGSISGAYSSPFTAVPLLVIWDDLRKKR